MIKVIAAHHSHFNAFRNEMRTSASETNREASRQMRFVATPEDLKDSDRIILVGPFWSSPLWTGIEEKILNRVEGQNVAIEWFPHARGQRMLFKPR